MERPGGGMPMGMPDDKQLRQWVCELIWEKENPLEVVVLTAYFKGLHRNIDVLAKQYGLERANIEQFIYEFVRDFSNFLRNQGIDMEEFE